MPETNKINYKYIFKVFVYLGALLVAIYLVILASGYKFDGRRNNFVETGNIYINSNPKDVKIYIDGKLKSKRAPFKLGYLLPGNYQVKIEKDGYKSWEKNLEVKAGLVTYESEIILFYDHPQTESFVSTENIKGMKINTAKDEILYFTDKAVYFKKTDSTPEQKIIELNDGIIEGIGAPNNFSKVLIQKRNDATLSYIYCKDRDCKEPYDLDLGLSLKFDKATFTNNDNFPLLLFFEGNLYSVKSDLSKHYIETRALDSAFFDGTIYYLTDDDDGVGVWFSSPDGSNKKKITTQKGYGSEKKNFSFQYDYKKDKLYLIGEGSDLFIINKEQSPKKLDTEASFLNFDNNNFLLITFGSEIKVQGKVEVTDEADSIHNVARYSQNPINTGWLLKTSHLLFIRDKILKTLEGKKSNETDLYSFEEDKNIVFISISKNEIIVLDKGRLTKLTVCEKGSLIDLWQ